MSLSSLKEYLKPRASSSSSFCCTSPCSSPSKPSQSSSSPSRFFEADAVLLRRPPKSSLSQQLRRCNASLDLPFSHSSSSPSRPPSPPAVAADTNVIGAFAVAEDGRGTSEGKKASKGGLRHDPRRRLVGQGEEVNESHSEEEDSAKEGTRGQQFDVLARPSSANFFSGSARGPFEPLVLSSPGECPIIQVPASINCRLLEHQREGVKFLYALYMKNHGGVLGDDMGLGKTIQMIAFLAAVTGKGADDQDAQVSKQDYVPRKGPILIISPTSVIRNWENEFSEWSNFSVAVYHGPNRDLILEKLEAQGVDVLITSFDTFRIHGTILSGVMWDIAVVDEAHRLKNEASRLYKACSKIKTRKRFGLTGTVMQNKIMELFNLFDWVLPGSLGTREHFREFYDEPLKHGQRLSAPERFVQIAEMRRQQLALNLHKYGSLVHCNVTQLTNLFEVFACQTQAP